MLLSPKTILITGASSGIGAALAKQYARTHKQLLLMGQNETRLKAVQQTCIAQGALCDIAVCSVIQREEMARLILQWEDMYKIDLVIANAGISAGTALHTGAQIDQNNQHFETERMVMAVNFDGVLNTLHPLIPSFKKRQSGQIAVVSSLASQVGLAGAAAYCASKAAIRVYAEAISQELQSENIAVSVICPGFVKSTITDQNTFKMPFLMPAAQAARYIEKALAKRTSRITFPWQMRCLNWILRSLPSPILMHFLRKLPRKA